MDIPSDSFNYSLTEVYPRLSTISAVLAAVVVLTMIALSLYDHKLVNRVSLRLQTVISAVDIWTHTTAFWFIYYQEGPSGMCTFIAWQRQFGPLMYLFFNVAIAANFQLVFLHEKVVTSKIELAYWFIPVIAGLIITIPPLAIGLTGYGDFNGCFFIDADFTTLRVADMLVSNIWYLLTWLYLVIVVGLVVFKLRKSATQLKFSQRFTTITDSDVAQKTIKSLIHRLLLYPIVAILSTLGIMASQLNHLRTEQEDWDLEIWAMNFLALTGTFNFIAFCFDPTFQNAIYIVYCRIRYGKEGANLVSTSINKEGPTAAFDIELGKLESTTSLNQYSNDYHLL